MSRDLVPGAQSVAAKEILQRLKTIVEDLKKIGEFTAKEALNLEGQSQKIEARTLVNNRQAEKFQAIVKTRRGDIETLHLGLEVLSENIGIHSQKLLLMQSFIQDLYQRIERVGEHTTVISKSLAQWIQQVEAKQ